MAKRLMLLVLLLLLIPVVLAIEGSVTTFTGETNPFNIIYYENSTNLTQINIPEYSYIKNISFTISDINYSNSNYSKRQSDEYLQSGWDSVRFDDQSYSPFYQQLSGGGDAYVYWNFSTINKSYDCIVTIRTSDIWTNYTLSNYKCFNINSTNQMRINVLNRSMNISCRNSSNQWHNIYTDGYTAQKTLYETDSYFSIQRDDLRVELNGESIYNRTKDEGFINISLNITKLNNYILNQEDINISIIYDGDTNLTINLTNATYAYGIDNCTNSHNIPSNDTTLNISFFDLSSNLISTAYDSIFSYGPNTTNYNHYFTQAATDDNFQMCIYPAWSNLYTEIFINYNDTYTYQTYQTNLTNVSQDIDLVVPLQAPTEVTLSVVDYYTDAVEDAYIQVQIYNINTNSYTTTEILRTDPQGEAVANILLSSEYYRFIIQYEGDTKLIDPSVQGIKIYSTTRTFRINLEDEQWYENYDEVNGISTDFAYNETGTDSFVFDWTNPTGTSVKGCLDIIKNNESGQTNIFSSCTSSSSASIVGSITPSECNTYTGIAYFDFTDDIYSITGSPIEIDIGCDYTFKDRKGTTGNNELILLSWMVIIGLALIGVYSPEISAVLATVGLVGVVALGLYDIAWQYIIGWVVIVILLIWKYSRR